MWLNRSLNCRSICKEIYSRQFFIYKGGDNEINYLKGVVICWKTRLSTMMEGENDESKSFAERAIITGMHVNDFSIPCSRTGSMRRY